MGGSGNANQSRKYLLFELDIDGNLAWQKHFGGEGLDQLKGFTALADGGHLLLGCSNSQTGDAGQGNGGMDGWALKVDKTGAIQWGLRKGKPGDDCFYSALEFSSGQLLIAGRTRTADANDQVINNNFKGWYLKLDSEGNLLWETETSGNSGDLISKLIEEDQSFVGIGETDKNNTDIWYQRWQNSKPAQVVNLGTPKNLRAAAEVGIVEVSWEPVSDAQLYRVFISRMGQSSWPKLVVATSSARITIRNLTRWRL